MAFFARAMARNTTRPGASAAGRRPVIWPCRHTSSCRTPKSVLADAITSARFYHERTNDLPAARPCAQMARTATADSEPHSLLVRGLPDAAQSELLVDVRRHSCVHARGADRHGHCPGDALHPACRPRF